MPRVSVLMTVFNGMPYLRDAVESILTQTFQDFEFVIVDDGSTDGTAAYLASVTDPRVRTVVRENGGTAAAANEGLTHCTGEFIARMDSDDVSLPHRLETQIAYLDAHPEVGLVGSQMAPRGDVSVGGSLRLPTSHDQIMRAMLEGRHGLGHSCILMRSCLVKQIGGYWKLRYQDAWDLMLRMGEASQLANVDEVLHHYRVHGGSLNGKGMQRMRFSIDYACELARRRRQGLPEISPEEFQDERERRPWIARALERLDVYARSHYRLALAELHGRRRLTGTLRMAYAAACQPRLSIERVIRVWLGRRSNNNGFERGPTAASAIHGLSSGAAAYEESP